LSRQIKQTQHFNHSFFIYFISTYLKVDKVDKTDITLQLFFKKQATHQK